jgi:hypothetical protein
LLFKTDQQNKSLPLQDISGTGIQADGGVGIFTGGVVMNTVNAKSLTPSSYVGITGGVSASTAQVSGSVQVTNSQPLLMYDFLKGFYLGKGKDE